MAKEGVKFSVSGDIGNANVTIREQTDTDKDEELVMIELMEPVSMKFGLRFLNSFAKATPLSTQVVLSMSKDLPDVVEYKMADLGHVRF
eukprot:1727736-Pyramimonas_sp.AAC.1